VTGVAGVPVMIVDGVVVGAALVVLYPIRWFAGAEPEQLCAA